MDATPHEEPLRGYLPLERRCAAPVFGLDPDSLQRSAALAAGDDDDERSPAQRLDAIVRALGLLAVRLGFAASQGGHRFAQAGEGGDQVGAPAGAPAATPQLR